MSTKLTNALLLIVISLSLGACGYTKQERTVSGAGLGAGAGYLLGAPLAGALVGGATGAFTDDDDVNMGEPLWEWD